MEDSKQGINLNLSTANYIGELNTGQQNYAEADHTSGNIHLALVKAEVNYPVELNGLSNKYVQDAESSTGFANLGMLQNAKNESKKYQTPQVLWRKRREAKQCADLAAKGSPSRYSSLYKARMSCSPSASTTKEHRGCSDGRTAWLMHTRTIRTLTPQRGPRSHLRSLSESNARTRKSDSGRMLRRPRKSLEPTTARSPGGRDPSLAQNISSFKVQPKFGSYQLVGDSLLVRFAEQILDIPCGTVEGNRGIGLCVSGQKSGDLLRRVHERMYPVTEKIVLLIGTNDVLQNISETEMCSTLERLLALLKMSVNRIVLLTLPPIPKLQLRREHWEKIRFYNNFIRSLQDEVVSVADIHQLYVTEKQGCKMEMFERYYGDGQRLDLIHLNRTGLEEIHKFLLQNNFLNLCE